MASRVNTKFVLILGVVLLAVFAAGAYVALESIRKSGDEYIQMGDQAMEAGKYPEAVGFYARAVYKDQRNPGWIRKWIAAMEKDTPKGRAAYLETYYDQYMPALRALADSDRADVDASIRYLDEQWKQVRRGASLARLESLMAEIEQSYKDFRGEPADAKKILRYRGLVRVQMSAIGPGGAPLKAEMSPEEIQTAGSDLEGALEVDPNDLEATLALTELDMIRARRHKERDEPAEYAAAVQSATERLDGYIRRRPPAAQARLARIFLDARIAQLESGAVVTLADFLPDRREQVVALVDAVLAEKAEEVDLRAAAGAARLALAALPTPDNGDAADRVVAHVLKGRPSDAEALLVVAEIANSRGDNDAAIGYLRRVVDLPDPPLSLEGLVLQGRRSQALRGQIEILFEQWQREQDLQKKQELAAKVKATRDEYVERTGEGDNTVLAIDARLAYMNGDVRGASTLLTRFNQQDNESDAASMMFQGDLMQRLGNIGAAQQAYRRVEQIAGNRDRLVFEALVKLSMIAISQQEFAEALRLTQRARKVDPSNEPLKEQEEMLEQLAGGTVTDPALAVLVEAHRYVGGVDADPDRALAILREGVKKHKDHRLHRQIIQIMMAKGDREGTLAAVDAALADLPEDNPMVPSLRKARENLTAVDTTRSILDSVDEANLSDLDKHLRKFEILTLDGKTDEAAAELQAAAKLAPEDPRVVEHLFTRALVSKDMAEAGRLAELAERRNLDQVNGQLFRARLLTIDSKFADAAAVLRAVTERDPLNFAAWRMMGGVQTSLGNAEAAVAAFAKAVEIRPSDVPAINGYIAALVNAGRSGEALTYARKARVHAASNPVFADRYLHLLANAPGGNVDEALELRRRIAETRPNDIDNLGQLALIEMQKRDWTAAKRTIERLRALPEVGDGVVDLEARLQALQGRFAEAEKTYDDYIAGLPKDKLNERPYLAAAELFHMVGQPDRAVAMLEKGRAVQPRETMVIDRQLGNVLFEAHRFEEAIAAYKRVLDAGLTDNNNEIAKRMLEAYLHLKDWARFDELMSALGDAADADPVLLVLAAEAALAQGDRERAESIYDRAVAQDARNFVVFMKRGDFYAQDAARARDAIADYEQAALLAPGSPLPRMRLASLQLAMGQFEQGAEQLEKALALDPGNDAMRDELIRLRLRLGQRAAAGALADQAIQLKPDSIEWLLRAGALMTDTDQPDRAAEYYGSAWEREKSLRVAVPYVSTLLRKSPPDLNAAVKIVNDRALEKEDEMPRRMLRAMVRIRARQPAEADQEVAAALAKVDQDNPGQVGLFMSGLESVYGGDAAAQSAAMERITQGAPLKGWLAIRAQMLKVNDPAKGAGALRALEDLANASEDLTLKASVYDMLANWYLQQKDWQRTEQFQRRVLEINPSEVATLNNMAYVMATQLGKPADALPHAEKAASLAPQSATVLDTLGTVHLKLRNCEEAVKALEKAEKLTRSNNESAAILVHLASAHACKGDKGAARGVLDRARSIIDSRPELKEQLEADLKEVQRQIDGN